MKIAVILNSTDKVLIASRYKYIKLLKRIYGEDVKLFYERGMNLVKMFKPDIAFVFGSFRNTYQYALSFRIPYILCDQDIVSMYYGSNKHPKTRLDEGRKIKGAKKIIFTSPDHRDYIIDKYKISEKRTMVLYLRPSIDDLDFEPLPKLKGKHLVYIGGLLDNGFPVERNGRFSYRCYGDIFIEFIKQGWRVHLYPARKRPEYYIRIGCSYHTRVAEGKLLYQELSRYTAGIQGFANINESYEYAKTCRPNKIWNYLAAGIPTIGVNPGNGIELFEGKWGYELKDLSKINQLDFTKLNLDKYRGEEIIEQQEDELKEFIEG